jgi:CRISPR-associated protein Csm1
MNVYDIVIAALLHDVGKPLQRSELPKLADKVGYAPQSAWRTSHLHVEWTHSFFQEYCPELETSAKLASSHHNTLSYAPESERWAAEIIRIADNVAAGHDRSKSQSKQDFKSNLLYPVFPEVILSNSGKTESHNIPLLRQSQFVRSMTEKEEFYPKNASGRKVEDYKKISEGFINSFKKLYGYYKKNSNQALFINCLDALLNEYFWCVPSNTQEEKPKGSLYHHSKITAMISSVLYQFYKDRDKQEILDLRNNNTDEKFLLIAAELSGIQKYIFELNTEHAKKAAKILRARSFKVKTICDMTLKYILSELELLPQNVLMNAGGKFIILAPNNSDLIKKLDKLKLEIEQELFKTSQGFLNININYNTKMSLANFLSKETDRPDNTESFKKIIENVFAELDLSKRRKFSSYLKPGAKWDIDNFIIREKLTSANICAVCKKRAVTSGDTCDSCLKEIELGKQLQHNDYGIIGSELEAPLISLFNRKSDFVLKKVLEIDKCIIEGNDYFALSEMETLLPMKANAVSLPVWQEHYSYFMQRTEENSDFLTFEDIAKLALMPESDGSIAGVPFLAVLKGDVDNLGLIFNKGIEKNYNVTVWSTLSSQIDLFFSRFIPKLIEKEFPQIYTVYTGGDDFVLVGPWNIIVDFTARLQQVFHNFCRNKDIHFSVGISLFHSKDPIKYAIAEAEKLLKRSKLETKDQVTIFDTTVSWKDFFTQRNIADQYNEWLKSGVFSIQTIYKLFEFNKMYLDYIKGSDPAKLMYISRLHYDLNRNIYQKGKLGSEQKDAVKDHEQLLSERESTVMRDLKIALHIALYNNRKGGKNV